MKYTSKKIAEIAQDKGMLCNIHSGRTTHDNLTDRSGLLYQDLIEWIFNEGSSVTSLVANIDWHKEWYNTLIPEIQDITNDCSSCKHYISKNEVLNSCENYEIAIPKHEGWRCNKHISKIQTNEFVLEGFIGMLLNWFEKNNLRIEITTWFANHYKFEIFKTNDWNKTNLFPINWVANNDYHKLHNTSSIFSKQQARHVAIKQVFKLLKKNQ